MAFNSALKAKTLALAIAIGVGGPATAVRADDLQDLKAQIEALQKKVGELEVKQETTEKKQAAVPDNVVTGGATKGSFKLPGSNTSVTLGGYVKLDAVFSNPSAGVDTKGDLFLDPTAIPVGPTAGMTPATLTAPPHFWLTAAGTAAESTRISRTRPCTEILPIDVLNMTCPVRSGIRSSSARKPAPPGICTTVSGFSNPTDHWPLIADPEPPNGCVQRTCACRSKI